MITFTIPGQPVPKGRPRFWGGRAVTPKRTREYEARVKSYARLAMAEHGTLDGPIRAEVVAVFRRPKRLLRKKDPAGRMWHAGSEDLDNVVKSTLDGINGTIYVDDKQVCSIGAVKVYAAKGEAEHVEVTLCRLKG